MIPTYNMGATQLTVGLSICVQVVPDRHVIGYQFKRQSGGTLAIVQGQSMLTTSGYILDATEIVTVYGPASFFLAAAGTASVVGIVFKYSQGFSLSP